MKQIQEVLTKLEPQLLMDINSSYYSIFKINVKDENFSALCKNYSALKDACYIMNPNFNNATGSIFISCDGETLLKADFFANLITHDPLDFNYSLNQYFHKHPFEPIFSQIQF